MTPMEFRCEILYRLGADGTMLEILKLEYLSDLLVEMQKTKYHRNELFKGYLMVPFVSQYFDVFFGKTFFETLFDF